LALGVLGTYLGISFLYFAVPVITHPGREWIGSGSDPQIFVWSLGWWPHAILQWQNPIFTHAVWTPVGLDLAWVSSIPGLALVLAPVTLVAGPVVAYNVASVLMPALAAWTGFLLCRHLTQSFWPSLAGGYLFGFSSFMLGHLEGHLHMSSVFLVPLVALVLLRYVEGSLDGRGLAWRLGLLLAAQLLLSTETLFTVTLVIAVALVLAAVLVPAARERLRSLPLPLGAAYLIAGVLTSPLIAHAAAHFQRESINKPVDYPADLANLVVPTRLAAITTSWTRTVSDRYAGNAAENGAYLGVPLLIILIWFTWSRRRSRGALLLVVLVALGVLCELGTDLHVRGDRLFALPWKMIAGLPLLDNVLPVRFSLYVALGAAVAAALWASSRVAPYWTRIALTAIAIAAIVPHVWLSAWHGHPDRPRFFTSGLYRDCLHPGETVLTLPYPSWNYIALWQAEAGYRFRTTEASLSPVVPPDVPDRETVLELLSNNPPAGGSDAIVQLARDQGADTILVDGRRSEPWRTLLAGSGLPSQQVGGVYLYDVGGTLGTCRSRSGRRGASSTSSTRTSAPAASSANRRPSSCWRAAARRFSCSTSSPTPPGT
jgi:hypothetical protein